MTEDKFKLIKEHLDRSIYNQIKFTNKEKKEILDKTSNSSTIISIKWIKESVLALVSIIIFFGFGYFMFNNQNEEGINADKGNNPIVDVDKNDEKEVKENNQDIKDEIVKEIEFLKSNFRIGMSEEEIFKLLGNSDYERIINDSEDGTYYDIKYQKYLVHPFTQKAVGTEIDIENITNGKIGLQIFIGMTEDQKAKRISMIYLENSKVMINFTSENQEFIEPVLH